MMQLFNSMKSAGGRVAGQVGVARWGTITNTRQTDTGYEVKVMLQPDQTPTGWLPVLSPYVGGGWGLVCPPVSGAQAFVVPDTGYSEHGVVVGLAYSTQMMPPQPGGTPVAEGQFALMHQNGSYLLFNDDDVILVTNRDLNATIGRNLTATVAGNMTATVSGTAAIVAPAIKLCKALSDALMQFCTSVFYQWAVGHTHGNGNNGSPTTPPLSAPPANSLTTVVTGE